MKQKSKVKYPMKAKVKNCRLKSKHKRNIQIIKSPEVTEKVLHCYFFNIKCYHAKRTFNCPPVAKQHDYHRSCKKSNMLEFQQNLQKHVNINCCSFTKISIKRKNCAARNFGKMVNFDFIYLINLESLMVSA